ncbi:MAG: substrate binding domain-containing protein, partial [Limnobacter sp.]|nr:substrate binding domain-containing protein [Limnobacter sp.]
LALLSTGKPRGLVRISMPTVLGEKVLAHQMEAFRAEYPEIQLQIDLSSKNAHLVEEGIDIALRFGELGDSTLRAQRIATIYRKVYASKDYIKRYGRPETPEDLVNHQTLAFSQRGAFSSWEFWDAQTGQKHPTLPIESWFTCSSPTMILQMVRAGLGVGRSAAWMVATTGMQDELVEVLADWKCENPKGGGVPFYFVYPPGPAASMPLKVRVVSDIIKKVFAQEFMGAMAQSIKNG